ncbi:MAG: hypothetical protein HY292_00750 [Planctomycetes bacterium]|nr:hypothetical protein [Planctomycetota bacterium]
MRLEFTSCLAVAAIVLLVAGCAATPSARSESPAAAELVGAWRSSVTVESGPFASIKNLQLMCVFNDGGTMTESANYDEAPPVPPAYGVWRATGPRTFEARYWFFNTKAPSRFEVLSDGGGWTPSGCGVLTEHITLSSGGSSYDSTLTLEMLDDSGAPTEGGTRAKAHGTRIGF